MKDRETTLNQRLRPSSHKAQQAEQMISGLQQTMVDSLSNKSRLLHSAFGEFKPVEWFRDGGIHGGGVRFVASDKLFNRASVNYSQVFYEDLPEKPLNSATALSTIIHPDCPLAPSIHMHISWTELKSGQGYWRIMADLNPAIANEDDKQRFIEILQNSSGALYDEASKQGDKYFFIPALNRHRGIAHFYLEQFDSGNWTDDSELATRFGRDVIEGYCAMFYQRQKAVTQVTDAQQHQQLEYHTLYFLQVLTLDRGTTSGLLTHSDNDIGILGSLPRVIDKSLLTRWLPDLPELQQPLLKALIDCLPTTPLVKINDDIKHQLAIAIRLFYQQTPQAIDLQAKGNVVPATVQNHRPDAQ